MTRALFLIAAMAAAGPAPAEDDATVVAARTIRAREIVAPDALSTTAGATPGALSDPADALGLEARVSIYAGRALRAGDLGPPAVVERNALVDMRYARGGLAIAAVGRALDRAGRGERVRVMNLDSRTVVFAVAIAPGVVEVR